jgi:hypothetical protein
MVAGEPVMELAAVRREQHAEALAFDIAGEQLANFRIVVDDENALRVAVIGLGVKRGCALF